MKTIYSLLLIFCASTALYAQQSTSRGTAAANCGACPRRGVKTAPSPTATPAPQQSPDFFVGEARVDVTKDETVVRLAMAQHGSVLIELPANDGPRYIIPGDPEMATVDQKALERNKRAIVVRPGAQFVPPLRNRKARTPAATVTAQMRSGLVVTFLFYPVEDLAQNVHRCVLAYNRDEVVARRRAAGLPVNLDMESRGEMAGQPAAPISISVDDSQGEKKESAPAKPNNNSTPAIDAKTELATDASALSGAASANLPPPNLKKSEVNKDLSDVIASSREALQQAVKKPKQFKHWTKATHGLALSLLQSPASKEYRSVNCVPNLKSGRQGLSKKMP